MVTFSKRKIMQLQPLLQHGHYNVTKEFVSHVFCHKTAFSQLKQFNNDSIMTQH